MELNIKTLYMIGGIVTVVSAGAALLTWYHHRDAPGLRAWAAALLLTVLGALILRLRTSDADLAPVLAADMLIVAGFAAMWLSLRFANQGRTDLVRMIAIAVGIGAAFLALFVVLRALVRDDRPRRSPSPCSSGCWDWPLPGRSGKAAARTSCAAGCPRRSPSSASASRASCAPACWVSR